MSSTIHTGDLRTRIIVQRPAIAVDDVGGSATIWHYYATIWGHITSVSGRDKRLADSEFADVTMRIITRSHPVIESDMRMIIDNVIYTIDVVMPLPDQPGYDQCITQRRGQL